MMWLRSTRNHGYKVGVKLANCADLKRNHRSKEETNTDLKRNHAVLESPEKESVDGGG
ncbi:hypothetical protein HanRHA438_Chr11g0503931 [Helianthus annuus]|nr:hypothetical protein HanRHA438_Chr11g0503931 [Helianthus annuus]